MCGSVNNPAQTVNDTCGSDSIVPSIQKSVRKKKLYSSSANGKTAIGNIKFGISESKFKGTRSKDGIIKYFVKFNLKSIKIINLDDLLEDTIIDEMDDEPSWLDFVFGI